MQICGEEGLGARRREVSCWFRCFGPAEASPVSRVPSFRTRTPNERRNVGRTDSKQDWSRRSYRLHGALFAERLIPPLLVPSFALLNVLFRTVAFALDYYYRRRIAIFMGHQTTRHARARSHDLLTTYRVRMGRHVTTLITTVLSRCISQPIMRTPLPAIAAPVLTCPATP